MNFLKRILPPSPDERQRVVFIGAGALIIAAGILRLALSRDVGPFAVLLTLGLIILDFGVMVKVHAVAKRRHTSQKERRGYDVQFHEFTTVQRRCKELEEELEKNGQDLRAAEAEERRRHMLNFDREEKREWAYRVALCAYYQVINENGSVMRNGAQGGRRTS